VNYFLSTLAHDAQWEVLPNTTNQIVLSSGFQVHSVDNLVSVKISGSVRLTGVGAVDAKFSIAVDGVVIGGTRLVFPAGASDNFMAAALVDSLAPGAHLFEIWVTTDAGTTVTGLTDDVTASFLATELIEFQLV